MQNWLSRHPRIAQLLVLLILCGVLLLDLSKLVALPRALLIMGAGLGFALLVLAWAATTRRLPLDRRTANAVGWTVFLILFVAFVISHPRRTEVDTAIERACLAVTAGVLVPILAFVLVALVVGVQSPRLQRLLGPRTDSPTGDGWR